MVNAGQESAGYRAGDAKGLRYAPSNVATAWCAYRVVAGVGRMRIKTDGDRARVVMASPRAAPEARRRTGSGP